MKKYDCVIIGGGHNGLVAAAYLAKAGKRVCVLERRSILGGCASTEELWPGFKISPAAYVISLLQPEITEELKLKQHGLKILKRDPSSLTPTLDGKKWLVLGHDKKATKKSIEQFSHSDATFYYMYEGMLRGIADIIEPLFSLTPPLLPPRSWRSISSLRNIKNAWTFYRAFKKLESDHPGSTKIFNQDAISFLENFFHSDILKATLATDAIIGAFLSPRSPGSASVLLHHVMGSAGGSRGVWGYVQGGMGGLANALDSSCQCWGVDIFLDTEVTRINVDNISNAVSGVYTNNPDHELIEAKFVASNVDAKTTFAKLIDASRHLPGDFLHRINNIDYSSASMKINLALDALPNFQNIDPALLTGTIHISPDVDYICQAFHEAERGYPSRNPVLEVVIPTTVDKTIAPEGKHIMSIFVQYTPYNIVNGNWDFVKETVAHHCIDILSGYAPNLRDIMLHKQVLSPVDLERVYGLTGGNIMQGAMGLFQLGPFRPVVGWPDYKSPIKGLGLCGAASHPGGGVMGTCGRNAAREILRSI